jgi:hypothetical protein
VAASAAAEFNPQSAPAAARLAGGGGLIAWRSGTSLLAQQLDAAGNAVGAVQSVGSVAAAAPSFAVAGTADGGWVFVWASEAQALQFRRYSAAAAPLHDAAPVDAAAFVQVGKLQVDGLADGGFVVAWSARQGSATAPQQVFARRFAAGATSAGDRVTLSTMGGDQSDLNIVPLGDGSFFAAWVQGNADSSAFSIVTRRLGADLQPVAAERGVDAMLSLAAAFDLSATRLANGNIALAWIARSPINGVSPEVRWQFVDASGASIGAPGSVTFLGSFPDALEVVPAVTGATVLVAASWAHRRGTNGELWTVGVDAAGSSTGATIIRNYTLYSVSPFTVAFSGPASMGLGAAGAADGRYLIGFESATSGDAAMVEALAR